MGENKEGHHAILNEGGEIEMEMFGYKTHLMRCTACILGYILSCGSLMLLFYWKPEWNVWANCLPCSLEEADIILLRTMDDFRKYARKKVCWIQLTTINNTLTSDSHNPIIADENSIMNKVILKPTLKVRYIQVQKIKYAWVSSEKRFQKVGELDENLSCKEIHLKYGSGLTSEEQDIRRLICGPNTIEVEVAPIWKLLFKEVLNLFYLYQFLTLTLWISEHYLEYSTVILAMSVISIILTLYELRQQSKRLHNLVESHNNILMTVCRKNGDYKDMESRHLVPGDVIILTGKSLYLPCDAILISGSCVINEGMLTGESIPVTKTHLPSEDNNMPWKSHGAEDYRRHVLFCGTKVIQIKSAVHGPVKAVVMRTGFTTAKGDLVRSILYPRQMNFKLHRDATRFFMFLVFLGLVGMFYAMSISGMAGVPIRRVVIEALLLTTAPLSPAIPAALAVGMIHAQKRLKQKAIFCISPQRINVCGQINLICFDKTGTLTEDGMDIWGLVPTKGNSFQKVQKSISDKTLSWGPLLGAMASCHSLIALDGKLQGDPLDQKMFDATGWVLKDCDTVYKNDDAPAHHTIIKPGAATEKKVPVKGVIIVHQYPFSSVLQRMSVITQVIGGSDLSIYMKGAPEKVASFCKSETVPETFSEQLEHYTCQGFRVIGLAYKTLSMQDADSFIREEVESDLEFLGLLILENKLKTETKPVLQELNNAKIRTVMITGDNLQTATTVAKCSSMISDTSRVILVEASGPDGSDPATITWNAMEENKQNGYCMKEINIDVDGGTCTEDDRCDYHFVMSGKSYEAILQYFYSLLPKILMNGTIFARMAPAQKSSLIEEFQKMDYYVAMCGDGANDCGALKMAHAGISLSEEEASVASPFTSKTANIECMAQLIKEGRAALVTSFCMFKYMALYGMTVYTAILLLYWQRNIFGNYQFLIQDLAITLLIFLTMSLNAACPKLAPYRPPGQLFSPPMLLSVVLNISFSLTMQIYGYVMVQKQPWYNSSDLHSACIIAHDNSNSMNNSMDMNVTANATIVKEHGSHESFENTTLWLLTTSNLVIVAFVFSKGRPFRQPLFTNYPFLFVLIAHFGLCIFLIFADIEGLYTVMELVCTPTAWRVHIFIIVIVHFSVALIVEEAILENRALWMLLNKYFQFKSQSQYKQLQHILEMDADWPPGNKTQHPSPFTLQIEDNSELYCNTAVMNHDHTINEKTPNRENKAFIST